MSRVKICNLFLFNKLTPFQQTQLFLSIIVYKSTQSICCVSDLYIFNLLLIYKILYFYVIFWYNYQSFLLIIIMPKTSNLRFLFHPKSEMLNTTMYCCDFFWDKVYPLQLVTSWCSSSIKLSVSITLEK